MRGILRSRIVLAGMLFVTAVPLAHATALVPNPELDISGQGLTLATGGTGMQSGAGTIIVDIGGPVAKAYLYWAGRDYPCAEDGGGNCMLMGRDQDLLFDGNAISGVVVGEEFNDAGSDKTNNIGYRADVTSFVQAKGTGMQSFDIEDGDLSNNFAWFNGAGLIVIYVDPADLDFYRVIVYEGLDFAYEPATPEPATVTEPVIFDFGAVGAIRPAEVAIFAGDAEVGRPDRVQIGADSILNEMDSDDGEAFDADLFPTSIPADATSLSVQLFSETTDLTTDPDSLLWLLGALRIPTPVAVNGRMTGGGHQLRVDQTRFTGRTTRGLTIHCDILLSNNLEVNWPGGNHWHITKPITSAICIDDPLVDPVPPAAPFDTFIGEAEGELNGVGPSIARFIFVDAGEPGRDDTAMIRIWGPNVDPDAPGSTPVHEVEGKLDGGNLQAHYDQPHN